MIMELPFAAPFISSMLMMVLIVFTGTAWFMVLHPQFMRRILQRGDLSEDPSEADGMLRRGGLLFGAAGLLLLILADSFP